MEKVEGIDNLIRFTLTENVGSVTMNRLIRVFGTSDNILGATESELREVSGINSKQIKGVLAARDIDPRPEIDLAAENGVDIIAYDDPVFPKSLLEASDPPFILYVKGTLEPSDTRAIGIVGTRQASNYGREQAELFGYTLAKSGYTVVSGLARGVDTFAHRGALNSGGRTIAVVGCGLCDVYPPENRDLMAEIIHQGAVVSEFAMRVTPTRITFPRRNRIIAGMSQGTLVIEAPERSGALITARQANEMGREVFALPGRVDQSNTGGCHALIRDGAVLVRNPGDILEEFSDTQGELSFSLAGVQEKMSGEGDQSKSTETELNEKEAAIMGLITTEEIHIDEICNELEMNAGQVASTLMILELKHKVRKLPGQKFVRMN